MIFFGGRVEGWVKKRVDQGLLLEEGGVLTVSQAFRSKKSPSVAQKSKVGAKGKQKETIS
jgi:hypothetical protein